MQPQKPGAPKPKKATKKTAKKPAKTAEKSFGMAMDLDDEQIMEGPPPAATPVQEQDQFMIFKAPGMVERVQPGTEEQVMRASVKQSSRECRDDEKKQADDGPRILENKQVPQSGSFGNNNVLVEQQRPRSPQPPHQPTQHAETCTKNSEQQPLLVQAQAIALAQPEPIPAPQPRIQQIDLQSQLSSMPLSAPAPKKKPSTKKAVKPASSHGGKTPQWSALSEQDGLEVGVVEQVAVSESKQPEGIKNTNDLSKQSKQDSTPQREVTETLHDVINDTQQIPTAVQPAHQQQQSQELTAIDVKSVQQQQADSRQFRQYQQMPLDSQIQKEAMIVNYQEVGKQANQTGEQLQAVEMGMQEKVSPEEEQKKGFQISIPIEGDQMVAFQHQQIQSTVQITKNTTKKRNDKTKAKKSKPKAKNNKLGLGVDIEDMDALEQEVQPVQLSAQAPQQQPEEIPQIEPQAEHKEQPSETMHTKLTSPPQQAQEAASDPMPQQPAHLQIPVEQEPQLPSQLLTSDRLPQQLTPAQSNPHQQINLTEELAEITPQSKHPKPVKTAKPKPKKGAKAKAPPSMHMDMDMEEAVMVEQVERVEQVKGQAERMEQVKIEQGSCEDKQQQELHVDTPVAKEQARQPAGKQQEPQVEDELKIGRPDEQQPAQPAKIQQQQAEAPKQQQCVPRPSQQYNQVMAQQLDQMVITLGTGSSSKAALKKKAAKSKHKKPANVFSGAGDMEGELLAVEVVPSLDVPATGQQKVKQQEKDQSVVEPQTIKMPDHVNEEKQIANNQPQQQQQKVIEEKESIPVQPEMPAPAHTTDKVEMQVAEQPRIIQQIFQPEDIVLDVKKHNGRKKTSKKQAKKGSKKTTTSISQSLPELELQFTQQQVAQALPQLPGPGQEGGQPQPQQPSHLIEPETQRPSVEQSQALPQIGHIQQKLEPENDVLHLREKDPHNSDSYQQKFVDFPTNETAPHVQQRQMEEPTIPQAAQERPVEEVFFEEEEMYLSAKVAKKPLKQKSKSKKPKTNVLTNSNNLIIGQQIQQLDKEIVHQLDQVVSDSITSPVTSIPINAQSPSHLTSQVLQQKQPETSEKSTAKTTATTGAEPLAPVPTAPSQAPEASPSPPRHALLDQLVSIVTLSNRRHLDALKERLLMTQEDIRSALAQRQERTRAKAVKQVYYDHIVAENVELKSHLKDQSPTDI